jgi:hypothetical protein
LIGQLVPAREQKISRGKVPCGAQNPHRRRRYNLTPKRSVPGSQTARPAVLRAGF